MAQGIQVYVRGYPIKIGQQDLKKQFSKYCPVLSVRLFKDYAFVTLKSSGNVEQALANTHNKIIFGQKLIVQVAKKQQQKKIKCYNCFQMDHLTKDCKKPLKELEEINNSQSDSQQQQQQNSQSQSSNQSQSQQQKKKKHKKHKKKHKKSKKIKKHHKKPAIQKREPSYEPPKNKSNSRALSEKDSSSSSMSSQSYLSSSQHRVYRKRRFYGPYHPLYGSEVNRGNRRFNGNNNRYRYQ